MVPKNITEEQVKRIRALASSQNSINKAMDAHFRALISRANDEDGIRKYQIAETAKCSKPTFVAKVKEPGKFTLAEIRAMAEFLKWTPDDIAKFVLNANKS